MVELRSTDSRGRLSPHGLRNEKPGTRLIFASRNLLRGFDRELQSHGFGYGNQGGKARISASR